MITEDYVSYETAKLLKEKGFDVPSFKPEEWLFCMYDEQGKLHWGAYSDNWYCRVTLQMAMKWLREIHKIYISISHRLSHNADNDVCFSFWINEGEITDGEWLSYEEACENAIRYVLENLI